MHNTSPASFSAHIPLLVGITGHRDPADAAALQIHIQAVLLDLGARYPATPIILLTPLAEGADRAAAAAVLALRATGATRYGYLAVLPMPEAEYKATFAGAASVREYEALRDQAIGCYTLGGEFFAGAPRAAADANCLAQTDHAGFPAAGFSHRAGADDNAHRIVQIRHGSTPTGDASCTRAGVDDDAHRILYTNLGAFLARHTQVLIAAWNGAEEAAFAADELPASDAAGQPVSAVSGAVPPPAKPGGTYHVLRMRFFGLDDACRGDASVFAHREFGPVYWIRTRRKSSAYLAAGAPVAGPAYPDFPVGFAAAGGADEPPASGEAPAHHAPLVRDRFAAPAQPTYEEILAKLDAYNADISRNYPAMADRIAESRQNLLTYSYPQAYPQDSVDKPQTYPAAAPEKAFLHHYAVADTLSQAYQKKRRRDVVFLIALAFLGLLSFNLYSGPLPLNWFILSYSAVYCGGILYYLHGVRANRYHERYIDYRGIAEGIRVQFFWHLAGVGASVADVYLTKQKSSLEWIRISLENTYLLCKAAAAETPGAAPYPERIRAAYRLWIEEQYRYYQRKGPEKGRGERRQERAGGVLFAAGLLLAVALAGLDTYEFLAVGTCGVNKVFIPVISNAQYEAIHKWLVFVVGFLPVVIASYRVFTDFLAYAKLARSYRWMAMVYGLARQEYTRLASDPALSPAEFLRRSRKLFYDVGVEALLENGEWIGTLAERVPTMPQ